MFLITLDNDKIIDSEKILEVRLTDDYPKNWIPDFCVAGAYFIVIDFVNTKGEVETVFYKDFPILDEDYAADCEYPSIMYGTKQEYLDGVAFKEAQSEMIKLCKKINRKPKRQNNEQMKAENRGG